MIDERRKHKRLKLRVAVLLVRSESDVPIWSETSDITNDGFYCTSPQPFSPGESILGLIALPSEPAHGNERSEAEGTPCQMYIEAQIEVVRVAVDNGNGFGLGCRMTDYRLIPGDAMPAWASVAGFNRTSKVEGLDGAVSQRLFALAQVTGTKN